MSKLTTPEAVVDALEALYEEAVAAQSDALNTFHCAGPAAARLGRLLLSADPHRL